ncbi:hypothetical protein ABR157_004552 [Enterobacter soli]
MKLTLKEMNGLLNGKCLPSDLLTGETLADYLFRKFDEARQQLEESHRALRAETTAHENTQMQLEKMAAEAYDLKHPGTYLTSKRDTPELNAFLSEVRVQVLTNYADKRGFSFQHGSIHAHFGNGDVMVGAVTFENGDAGINFAPVRDKTGGVGTSYEWTKGKTADQVDSVFIIASSNAEGLEVIRDKLSEAIDQLRKVAQS